MSYKFVCENVSTKALQKGLNFRLENSINGRFPAFFVCVDNTDDDLAKLKKEKNKKRVLYVLDDLKKGEYNIKEKCGLNLMDEIGSSEEGQLVIYQCDTNLKNVSYRKLFNYFLIISTEKFYELIYSKIQL